MKIEIPLDALTQALIDIQIDFESVIDDDPKKGPDAINNFMFGEIRGKYAAFHRICGFYIDMPNSVLHVNTAWLHLIAEMAGYVMCCYENENVDLPDNLIPGADADAWALFDLAGDGDVDNCGGNVLDVCHAVYSYCNAHDIEIETALRS